MNESVISVRISEPLFQDASNQARQSGMSLEDWLIKVAADRVRDEQVAERFFSYRMSQELAGRTLRELLDKAPNNPPDPGDELPEGYVPSHPSR